MTDEEERLYDEAQRRRGWSDYQKSMGLIRLADGLVAADARKVVTKFIIVPAASAPVAWAAGAALGRGIAWGIARWRQGAAGASATAEVAPAVSNIRYADDIASIAKAAPGEDVVVLGQYRMVQEGRTLVTRGVVDEVARQVGGRTLATLPGDMSVLAPEIVAADRIIFVTSSNMGSHLTAAEMNMIQSLGSLREKTTFVVGAMPR